MRARIAARRDLHPHVQLVARPVLQHRGRRSPLEVDELVVVGERRFHLQRARRRIALRRAVARASPSCRPPMTARLRGARGRVHERVEREALSGRCRTCRRRAGKTADRAASRRRCPRCPRARGGAAGAAASRVAGRPARAACCRRCRGAAGGAGRPAAARAAGRPAVPGSASGPSPQPFNDVLAPTPTTIANANHFAPKFFIVAFSYIYRPTDAETALCRRPRH